MELLDLPEEILLEILSNLDQATVHLTVAFVCKRFLQLTRTPQLLKCVEYQGYSNKFQSLLVMLRDNKHLRKLILAHDLDIMAVLEILKVVAPHGSLRHLEFGIWYMVVVPVEWNEVFSQICAKLTSIEYFGERLAPDCLAPLEKAKNLTWLKLQQALPTAETFRQMANNYMCLQNIDLNYVDCSEKSAMAYFLEKQSHTLTSLRIMTDTKNALAAIYKCRNLKKLHLFVRNNVSTNLDSLGGLSKLKCLRLQNIDNSDLGKCIAAAKFQDLTEIHFICALRLSDKDVSQIASAYGQQV
jgi:hypothetical protein